MKEFIFDIKYNDVIINAITKEALSKTKIIASFFKDCTGVVFCDVVIREMERQNKTFITVSKEKFFGYAILREEGVNGEKDEYDECKGCLIALGRALNFAYPAKESNILKDMSSMVRTQYPKGIPEKEVEALEEQVKSALGVLGKIEKAVIKAFSIKDKAE